MQRVQKIIANAGICSRRKAEVLIEEGRVQVNGKVISLGDQADMEKDKIVVDGNQIKPVKRRYIMFHKPEGYLTTLDDPRRRKTIFDVLCLDERLIYVGRLDMNTSGLLLLTNDGDFANQIMHPRFEVEKTYEVITREKLSPMDRARLESGVSIEGQMTWPARVQAKGIKRYHITIHEGRNRIIRKMLGKVGCHVVALKRTAIGPLLLGNLRVGEFRDLTKDEKRKMLEKSIKAKPNTSLYGNREGQDSKAYRGRNSRSESGSGIPRRKALQGSRRVGNVQGKVPRRTAPDGSRSVKGRTQRGTARDKYQDKSSGVRDGRRGKTKNRRDHQR